MELHEIVKNIYYFLVQDTGRKVRMQSSGKIKIRVLNGQTAKINATNKIWLKQVIETVSKSSVEGMRRVTAPIEVEAGHTLSITPVISGNNIVF